MGQLLLADVDANDFTALRVVIGNCEMMRWAFIPQDDIADCPLPPDAEVGIRTMCNKKVENGAAFGFAQFVNVRGEFRIHVDKFLAGRWMRTDDGLGCAGDEFQRLVDDLIARLRPERQFIAHAVPRRETVK